MKLKSKHISFVSSGASYLEIRHLKGMSDQIQLDYLFSYAKKDLGVKQVVQKTLSGPRDRTSTALRRTIILSKDFFKRKPWEQIKILRHEMAHIKQQAKHGTMFWLRYLSAPWRWAYEVAAEREAVRFLAERGWDDADLKKYIDSFVGRVFTSKTWILKRLDGNPERKLTEELLWDGVADGRR